MNQSDFNGILYKTAMDYPNSKKTAKLYASYLTELHGKPFFAVERIEKIKNKYAINFAAGSEKEELADFIVDGWEIVE